MNGFFKTIKGVRKFEKEHKENKRISHYKLQKLINEQ